MNAQLLLLLALAGPFCVFTRASPTVVPITPSGLVTQTRETTIFHATESPKGPTVFTGPPPTEPKPVPQELNTEARVTVGVHQELTTEEGTEVIHLHLTTEEGTEVIHPNLTTEEGTEVIHLNLTTEEGTEVIHPNLTTEEGTEVIHQHLTTEVGTEVIHQHLTTEAGAEVTHQHPTTEATSLTAAVTKQTPTNTEEAKTELRTHASTPETAAPTEKVDQTSPTAVEEASTAGQVAGISFGVLIALVFVIAIVIIMAKRMGKYSP
ncbi:unnamed protein product [Tetraodon nigroviridis]|uniref:(spotted green pufferfish) hypothetical protein n=1 Tax=Tetraodon nigroviridis TaxID=99883 RepID=Q4RH08_TETNG|nr:unnamed protein product [Tetraodon nigroviridis]